MNESIFQQVCREIKELIMPSVIVVGAQWGDEGKGKVTDVLASNAMHIVRAQGGNNAGHTVLIGSNEYKLHLIPSGILHPHTQCYIGAGTVLDLDVLIKEIEWLESLGHSLQGRLWISPEAHIIFPYHKQLDILLENKKGNLAVETTGRGIGPCYADKANRLGIRLAELVCPNHFPKLLKAVLCLKNEELTQLYGVKPLSYEAVLAEYTSKGIFLNPYLNSFESHLYESMKNNENVLFEGAQGTFLDVNFGTYPFVTSSITIASGICAGAGIGPCDIDHVLGVAKAYTTRVGNGPFPSEVIKEEVFIDHEQAREYGTTTGRKRRVGWLDAVLLKKAVSLNGLQALALTKLDVLDPLDTIKICIAYRFHGRMQHHLPRLAQDCEWVEPVYEILSGWKTSTRECKEGAELPEKAKNYIRRIEMLCGVPVNLVSVGPKREETIILQHPFEELKKRK